MKITGRSVALATSVLLGTACSATDKGPESPVANVPSKSLRPQSITAAGLSNPVTSRLSATSASGWSAIGSLGSGGFRVGRQTLKRRIAEYTPDAGLLLPHWTSTFTSGGTSFEYAILGGDPALGQTTTIPAVIIPYRIEFSDGTVLDASTDLIDGVTPLEGIMNSPVFQPAPFSSGTTSLGTTQWGDAILRANFWDRRPPGDGYHVLLAPTVLPTVTVSVPAEYGVTSVDPGSGRTLGVVSTQWTYNLMASEIAALGITPDQVAINIFPEVLVSTLNGVGSSLGYHWSVDLSSVTGIAGNQTYIQVGYFGETSIEGRANAHGTGVLGHELVEWLNDPNLWNIVPSWQIPDEPGVCYSPSMEVADPIEYEPVHLEIPLGGNLYNFPDVTFHSYFTHAAESHSVNGWRTLLDTYTTSSVPCSFDSLEQYSIWFNDDSGAPLVTAFTGVNNTKGAVGYLEEEGGLFGFEQVGYDPVGGTYGTTAFLGVPVPGQPGYVYNTVPAGISDGGTVVGYYSDGVTNHGFIETAGVYSTVDVPGAVSTVLTGTNNRKNPDYVGQYLDAESVAHGFVLRKGKFTTIDAPFGTNASVNGINDHRQIVGAYESGSLAGGFEAKLADSDSDDTCADFVAINYPPDGITYSSFGTQLTGVNNLGEVVGFVTITNPQQNLTLPVEVINGIFQVLGSGLDLDGAPVAAPNAVNDSGVIVGGMTDPEGTQGNAWLPYGLFPGFTTGSAPASSMPLPPGRGTILR
jgi:hypothetical protein